MSRANDSNSDDYLQDKDMLSSLRDGIKFAKEDKHNVVVHAMTQASKSADYILEA